MVRSAGHATPLHERRCFCIYTQFNRINGMFYTCHGIAYAAVAGSFISAVADNWNYNASNPCLHCGGNYNQNQNHGLFYVNYNNASNTNANIGCRILVFARPHQR